MPKEPIIDENFWSETAVREAEGLSASSPMAEASGLSPDQCGFESHVAHNPWYHVSMDPDSCVYCGRDIGPDSDHEFTWDHALPKSRYAKHHTPRKSKNKVPCCFPCNQMKHAMTLHEFVDFLKGREDILARTLALRETHLRMLWHVDGEGKPLSYDEI